jgi:hypothetical protein
VCTEPELLKVKVPMIFLGTVGVSPPREGRYLSILFYAVLHDLNLKLTKRTVLVK